MKKIFTLLVALISITTLFAQSDHRQYGNSSYDNGQYRGYDNSYDNGRNYHQQDGAYTDHVSSDRNYRDRDYNDKGYNESERNDNRGYGERGYNARTENYGRVERNNYYYGNQHYGARYPERTSKLSAVGAGLVIGGIIAMIAGSH